MMKLLSRNLRLVLLAAVFVSGTRAADKDAEEVRQAEGRWIAAIKNKDKAALEAILSKDLVYTHSTGIVEDKNQYIAAVISGNQKYDGVDYEQPAIRVYGTTAVVATKATMSGASKGTPFNNQLRLLHVWVKQAGKWALVAHQTTRLP